MKQSYFDKHKLKKEALTLFLISFFIFVLTCVSLFAQTNTKVLSVIAAEPAGYVGYYDTQYDVSNDATIEKIIAALEEDTADRYDKEIYVLNKDRNTILSSTGDVSDKVKEQLTSNVNEKLISIDNSTCHVADFEHYKLLVKASIPQIFNEFVNVIGTLALIMLSVFIVALIVLALLHKFFAQGSPGRLVATIVLILAVVFSFAGGSLYVELETINLAKQTEESNLKLDIEAIYQNADELGISDQAQFLEVANSIAQTSQTLKEVRSSSDLQGKAIEASSVDEILSTFEIVPDDAAINNLKMNAQIQALLMLLLAFMLVYELQNKARMQQKQRKSGAKIALTASDYRMRTVLMVKGVCLSAFSVVNVLRIRQVVMIHWTDNVTALISAIFTCTMLASLLGSSISSTVLKSCKNVKTYSILVMGIAMVGAFMCGASSNIVIFLAGLMIFNAANAQITMLSDFYSSLISDVNRKDSCQLEFASADSLGRVVGNIIGGVISVVLSFAVVQMMAASCLGIALIICLAFNKSELKVNLDEAHSAKSDAASLLKCLVRSDVLIYSICIVVPTSITYTLVNYKLPLDVAALGLSVLVVSLAQTTQKVIGVYANSLYSVVNRRVSTLFHIIAYVAISGGIVLFYMQNNSLVGMIVAVAAIGFLDGAGFYATTKAFREMEALSETQESDRMVGLSMVRKIGDTISPTLMSIFGNGAALPLMIIAAPFAYLVKVKSKLRALKK